MCAAALTTMWQINVLGPILTCQQFLPLLQGVLFIVIGLLLLTRETSWAQRLLDRLKAQHPRVDAVVGRAETIAQRLIVRVETWLRRAFGGATS